MHHHRRGPWSSNEDNQLLHLVQIHGAHNWVRISSLLGSRTPKQCRERYHQNLKPTLNHDPITPEEGALIEKLVMDMGKRWAEIARHLKGRSDNAVKNWWNGGQNRRRRVIHRHRAGQHYQTSAFRTQTDRGSVSPYSTPSPLPSAGLTIDIARRHSDDMSSPSYTDLSGHRTPSLASDNGSSCSISPRVPASPVINSDNKLPPILGLHSHDVRRQSMPNLPQRNFGEPHIVDHSDFCQRTPRFGGEQLQIFMNDESVKLPPITGLHTALPSPQIPEAEAPKDGRMRISNILG